MLCPLLAIADAFRYGANAVIVKDAEIFWWFTAAGHTALRRWSERRASRTGGVLSILLKARVLQPSKGKGKPTVNFARGTKRKKRRFVGGVR